MTDKEYKGSFGNYDHVLRLQNSVNTVTIIDLHALNECIFIVCKLHLNQPVKNKKYDMHW